MQPEMTELPVPAAADPSTNKEAALRRSPRVIFRSKHQTAMFIVGIVAYCAGLIAMIPARYVVPEGDRVQIGGTAWNGEAVLGSAMRIEWHWSPLETLMRGGFTAAWRMTGADTDLAGMVMPGRHTLRLLDVSGQADGTLLDAAAPDLPFSCQFIAHVDIRDLQVGGGDQQARGTLRSTPVRCTARIITGASLDLPALRATIEADRNHTGSSGALVTVASQQHLAELRLSRSGALSLWPAPALIARAPIFSSQRLDTTIAW